MQVALPIFHIAGTCVGCFSLLNGTTATILADPTPTLIMEDIVKNRVTQTFWVPALILLLVQTIEQMAERPDLSSLGGVFYGGSPIPADLLRQALETFDCDFWQVYGLTETTGTIVYLRPEDHDPQGPRFSSCGKPYDHVELRVVDGNGADAGAGKVGEIITRSDNNMLGYWNLPEATAKSVRDGWFYTGDAGYLDADGYLYIYDRVKDMIVSGGENVYPAEVESALFAHPDVADVAVIGVPDKEWGETVKAVVVRAAGSDLTAEALIADARQRLAGFKLPSSVDFVDSLPRNPSGKLLKREIRAPYWEGRERQVN